MKIAELLTEVADRPYRYLLAKRTLDSSQYIFITDVDTKYLIDVAREKLSDGSTRIIVGFADVTDQNDPTIDITGRGDAFRIFATVAAVTKEYIAKSKIPIDELMFKGKTKDPTRIKLYDRIARNLDKFLYGFRFKGTGDDGQNKVYYFERIKGNLTEAGAAPIYYFAYGMLTDPSNMPSARLIGPAILPNFQFEMFEYANVVPAAGSRVIGTLWELDRALLHQLDQVEEYPTLYDRKTVPVIQDGKRYEAELYTMTPSTRYDMWETRPRREYIKSLIRGYKNAGIPLDQIRRSLERAVTEDAVAPMRTLWHTSLKSNRASILSTGLEPRLQMYTEIKRTPGIYMFESLPQAKEWAYWSAVTEMEPFDIWEIAVPRSYRLVKDRHHDMDIYNAVIGYETILPDQLRLVKTQGVPKNTAKHPRRAPLIPSDITEAPLTDFKPIGDFTKPGPFRGADKRLVPHPVNKLKAEKFFSKTPYDIRLFFSNIPGTGKYSEYGPMYHDELVDAFGPSIAQQIIKGSDDAITIVFVGNRGDAKVPLTPWIMAHRFGHAIQAGVRNNKWSAWIEAERHFFSTVNQILEECYGKMSASRFGVPPHAMTSDLTPEYNALFNAIGTQRSSRTGKIKRPYEFLYELFAQYLKDGEIALNPLPVSLGYGRQAWGKPTKYMHIKPEYRSEGERQDMSDRLARDMGYMFDSVMSGTVGKILVI